LEIWRTERSPGGQSRNLEERTKMWRIAPDIRRIKPEIRWDIDLVFEN
jgi:hypothetical protein